MYMFSLFFYILTLKFAYRGTLHFGKSRIEKLFGVLVEKFTDRGYYYGRKVLVSRIEGDKN